MSASWLSLESALDKALSAAHTVTECETVSLFSANNRIVATDIVATLDVPPWDNSAMDGYAVNTAGLSVRPVHATQTPASPGRWHPTHVLHWLAISVRRPTRPTKETQEAQGRTRRRQSPELVVPHASRRPSLFWQWPLYVRPWHTKLRAGDRGKCWSYVSFCISLKKSCVFRVN